MKSDMVQRGHVFAIVDEVDSILIDEARTPLIISGQGEKSTDLYEKADRFVCRLKKDEDYTVEEKDKAVVPHRGGRTQGGSRLQRGQPFRSRKQRAVHHYLIQALKAHTP